MEATNVQYRVRPVTRYIVTRADWVDHGDGTGSHGQSSQHGEFDNFDMAYAVGYALCKAEHDRLGYPLGDKRIVYPDAMPDSKLCRAKFFRKMADELTAMEAQERYRREHPDALKVAEGCADEQVQR